MKLTGKRAARMAARLAVAGCAVALVATASAPAWGSARAHPARTTTSASGFPTGKVTLTLATEDTSTLTPALVKGFEKLHPNVTIQTQITSYTDYTAKIALELASSTPPDLSRDGHARDPGEGPPAAQPRPLREPVRLDEVDLALRAWPSTGWGRTSSPGVGRSMPCRRASR